MTHFPHIQALARFAQNLDDGASQAGQENLVFTDHLEMIEGFDHEAGALQEIMLIITEQVKASIGASASQADRMVQALGGTAATVIRYGFTVDAPEPNDTIAVRALYRSFTGTHPVYQGDPLDSDIPF